MKTIEKVKRKKITYFISFDSHPRRDKKILDLASELGEAHYTGGIGRGGWRVVSLTTSKPFSDIKEKLSAYQDKEKGNIDIREFDITGF